ncbi:hypothetical protein PUNSTDRAFT_125070 [Punctularia strigosozonata HHB-11173 SS5]|uniref:uncharacterized protein n=1 Tax=Punctularia strigosozonata (strain HHB-11173) TaxID=741275 RepID=UPI0004416353|nr:uncharacterized protein PUNSTDRAFT_125070 [Punctularia strigosozonata HHB-11173 SS5]EIN11964.1 hypothetical protein PUNSTDRAFT_125070 [Punctularia strigosozonata HHB-11173 SS5]
MATPAPDRRLGIVCTQEEWEASQVRFPSIHCLSRGDTIGLTLRTACGFLSFIAVLLLFFVLARNMIRRLRLPEPPQIFMITLFTFDAMLAWGRVVDAKWIGKGSIIVGGFCTMEGGIETMGEAGGAMTTIVISVYTFLAVWARQKLESKWVAMGIVTMIYLYNAIFFAVAVTRNTNFEAPTPNWCWIGPRYNSERVAGEYFWLWLALGVSIALYIPLWLWKRGNITIDDHKWWSFELHRQREYRSLRSMDMLAYPIVYSICVLPLSITRWIQFYHPGRTPPAALSFLFSSFFSLNGLFNVILFLYTRPDLIRAQSRERSGATDRGAPPSPVSSSCDNSLREMDDHGYPP